MQNGQTDSNAANLFRALTDLTCELTINPTSRDISPNGASGRSWSSFLRTSPA